MVEQLSTTEIFVLPNWVINDPCPVKVFEEKTETEEMTVDVQLIHVFENKTFNLKSSNKITIDKVKEFFMKEAGLDEDSFRLRFLYKGQELKDSVSLEATEFKTGDRIQVAVIKR